MRLRELPALPANVPDLVRQLTTLWYEVRDQVNQLSEGKIVARYNASTSAPVTGTYQQSDFIPNSAVAELGAPGSRYVLLGWVCTASGTPGTWRECRSLTGN